MLEIFAREWGLFSYLCETVEMERALCGNIYYNVASFDQYISNTKLLAQYCFATGDIK